MQAMADEGGDAGDPILSVRNLTTSFRADGGWRQVVRDLSFDVAPRETVAIVGESGSGKSVTALSIMRLVPPATGRIEGRISLAGRDLLELPEAAMRAVRGADVSMIFQEPMTSLNPIMTVGRQIGRSRCAATSEIFDRFGGARRRRCRLLDRRAHSLAARSRRFRRPSPSASPAACVNA